MNDRERERYAAEVERIRYEMGLPPGMDIIILDCDVESSEWLARRTLGGPEAQRERARNLLSMNREEGGE